MEKVFYMTEFSLCYSLTRYVIQIILQKVSNDINRSLYFLWVALRAFTKTQQLYHCLWKYNLTNFKINLIIFEHVDLINAPFYTHILENSYNHFNDFVFFLFCHLIDFYFLLIINKVYLFDFNSSFYKIFKANQSIFFIR